MTELIFDVRPWLPFDGDNGAVKEIIIRKKHGKATKRHSVIIWSIQDPDHKYYGKFFIILPSREETIDERIDAARYDSLESAKRDAENILKAHLELVKSGEINWWSRKRTE